jgi:hypothetical protein
VLPGASQVAGAAVEVAERRLEPVKGAQPQIPARLLQRANARLRTVEAIFMV